jgi:hypothetical protein
MCGKFIIKTKLEVKVLVQKVGEDFLNFNFVPMVEAYPAQNTCRDY